MHWPSSAVRWQARQRIGEHVCARQAKIFHGACRDDEGLRRIEPAGDPDDGALDAGCPEPGRKTLNWML